MSPVSIEQIRKLIHGEDNRSGAEAPRPQGRQGNRKPYRPARGRVPADTLAADLDTRPRADATLVAAECGVFGEFVRTRGDRIAEPLWFACLSIADRTAQGRDFALDNSRGDARFSAAETLDKLNRLSGPATCEYIQRTPNPHCAGCKHRGTISSPIQLGSNYANGHAVEFAETQSEIDVILPDPFCFHDGSLCLEKPQDKGPPQYDIISKHRIGLKRINTNESGSNYSSVFSQYLPHKGWFDFTVSNDVLRGNGATAALAGCGANIGDQDLWRRYLLAATDEYHARRAAALTYEQFGWKPDGSFLLGNVLYTKDKTDRVTLIDALAKKAKHVGPVFGGSEERWRAAATALFAKDCEAQSATVLAGFASVLMKFTSTTEGGAIWSLVTPGSATGKTTAALGAITIWGRPEGLELKTEFTSIVRGLTLAACGSLPTMHDELRANDQKVMRDYVLQYTSGRDKDRAKRDGSLNIRENSWQNILITTDNFSLVQILQHTEQVEDAAQMRVIELSPSIPEGQGARYGDKLRRELLDNAGHAGAAFISYLLDGNNLEIAKQLLDSTYLAIRKETGWDERYRFWTRTLAAIFVAGRLVNKAEILEFDTVRIVKWLIAQLQERAKPKKTDWEPQAIAMFMDQHANERLNIATAFSPGRQSPIDYAETKSGKVSIRYEMDRQRIFISIGVLKAWINKNNLNYDNLIRSLIEKGVVIDRLKKITLGAGTRYASGQVYTVEIDGAHPLMSGVPREVFPEELADRVVSLPPRS